MNKLLFLITAILLGCSTSNLTNSVKDADGNEYNIVTIDSVEWFVENLQTTKYNDGTLITEQKDTTKLDTLPSFIYYNQDEANKDIYGALYNWYAVNTNKLCPKGWQVPSKTDWENLLDFLGGEHYAGGKLKEDGTAHWKSPNNKADNSSGFTALPGGILDEYGEFQHITEYGGWWSSSEFDSARAPSMDIHHMFGMAFSSGSHKKAFFSVRCMRKIEGKQN